MPQAKEACPHGLAPTTSTVMQLALGDCLAMALLDSKGFTARDFKALHPGGQLGARLKFVSDLMHKGDRLPLTAADAVMTEAIVVMTEKALGCLGVVDDNGFLKGIITDGDLRRHMGDGLLSKRAQEIMTPAPENRVARPAGERRAGNDQLVQDHHSVRGRERPPGRHHPHPRPASRRRRLAPEPRRSMLPDFRSGSSPIIPPGSLEG